MPCATCLPGASDPVFGCSTRPAKLTSFIQGVHPCELNALAPGETVTLSSGELWMGDLWPWTQLDL